MTSFPGSIYDGQGASLDLTVPDLVQEQVDACPHRSLVTDRDAYPHRSLVMDRDVAPIVRVWLLADDATPDAIPAILMVEAVKLVLAGRRADPGAVGVRLRKPIGPG